MHGSIGSTPGSHEICTQSVRGNRGLVLTDNRYPDTPQINELAGEEKGSPETRSRPVEKE